MTNEELPVSTGPDNEKYAFSSSPSISPQVSPVGSSQTSAANIHLMHGYEFGNSLSVSAPSSFSVDRVRAPNDQDSQSSSCLKELLEWFVLRCCICCSWNFNSPSKLHES